MPLGRDTPSAVYVRMLLLSLKLWADFFMGVLGFVQIEDDGQMAVARMANGRTVHAQLLVGADGNRSIARQFVQVCTLS